MNTSKYLSENKEDVLQADSTTISVVIGYSENNRKTTRFSYQLPQKVVEKIATAHQVMFRYYAGPSMITVKLKQKYLKKLKKLINCSGER